MYLGSSFGRALGGAAGGPGFRGVFALGDAAGACEATPTGGRGLVAGVAVVIAGGGGLDGFVVGAADARSSDGGVGSSSTGRAVSTVGRGGSPAVTTRYAIKALPITKSAPRAATAPTIAPRPRRAGGSVTTSTGWVLPRTGLAGVSGGSADGVGFDIRIVTWAGDELGSAESRTGRGSFMDPYG